MSQREYQRQWYLKNRERILAKQKLRYRVQNERIRSRVAAYKKANPDMIFKWQALKWAKKCLGAARASSKRRGHLPPSITEQFIEELYEKQNRKCYWTGVEMVPSPRQHDPLQPSLERLDNALGYVPGNVVLACYCINRARRDLSVEVFEAALRKIAAALIEKNAYGLGESGGTSVPRAS